jgi:hypothetical protein
MRTRLALFVPLVLTLGCSRKEAPPPAAQPAAPTGLTEADVAGTWTGTASPEGSDSVAFHWKQVCAAGACTGTAQEMADTNRSTYRIEGDSTIGVTAPFKDPAGGGQVIEHWVAHISGNSISGRAWYGPADKPDSVTARLTFKGTKQ